MSCFTISYIVAVAASEAKGSTFTELLIVSILQSNCY